MNVVSFCFREDVDVTLALSSQVLRILMAIFLREKDVYTRVQATSTFFSLKIISARFWYFPHLVNTVKGRRKEQNIQDRSKVGLVIVDPSNPWHWLSVRGHIAEITEAGANEHINKMSKTYTGQDKYGFHQPGDVRVICKIMLDRLIAQ